MVVKKIITEGIQDDIVISGMSGRFPECDNISEFQEKLFAGVDLIKENDSRWPKGYLGTYSRMGFIKDLRNFDAPFFGAHPKLATRMDPIVRVLLETSVEAVMDAGICPTSIRGTETGVVVAVSSNEAADWWSADPDRVNGYEFLGCTRTMYSNRISFALDLKGPSYTMDSQSSSGLLGVQQGYYMLKTGMVDAVIVAGVNLILNPHFNIMFQKLNMLSPEGKCKVFDSDADGYARSEAGVAILMQRRQNAKRVYATVVGTESSCDGFKEYGCNTVSVDSQINLYKDTYDRFNLNPLDITFVEAHGYSTKENDKTELNGIVEIFCKKRDSPLLIGSVKSNIGHSEPAGGLVSLVKILLAMETGILSPNLHYKSPNPDVPALKDGRLKVVDKLTVWNGKYAAINSFGIGGTNSHLVLKRNEIEKSPNKKTEIPRIMAVSGRTESAVQNLLKQVESLRNDNEFCALLYSVFSQHIFHYNYRGFAIYDNEPITEISIYTPKDTSRPVCFVFSGMGSQWPGMCKNLLQIPNFKKTIDECAQVLKTVDFNLYNILNSEEKNIYNDVLNSFVGITCIQIALVNILHELDIKPDFIIGHSIGELACAYADETLTLEQTVLATYWRGKSLLLTDIPSGAMAAIGLSHSEIEERLPAGISVACHNSADSVTISGPPETIKKFTEALQTEGIFAREVNSSGFAFHSQYIAKAGPVFETKLEKIISQPKLRTKRWISTSVPESLWNTPIAQYSSVAYHLNNLLSPVFFSKALNHVPENAVIIEIAPHALLQSILKSGLSSSCSHIGLVRRNQASVTDFLSNIGRLYTAGLQPKLDKLYAPVKFPVSRKTPMIQSLIEWDHSNKWFLISFMTKPACVHGEAEYVIDITDEKYNCLRECFPISGYLLLIWETVAKFQLESFTNVPIVIENFQLLSKRVLNRKTILKYVVNILENSGECEIKENGEIVARAIVRVPQNINEEFSILNKTPTTDNSFLPLKYSDVYQDLYLKGYWYNKELKGIMYTDNKGENGKIKWSNNWTQFLESMLQIHILRLQKIEHAAIRHINKIVIDPRKHLENIKKTNAETGIPFEVFSDSNTIKSGGIELRGLQSYLVTIRKPEIEPTVSNYRFTAHISDQLMNFDYALSVCTQLVCENNDLSSTLKIAEITNGPTDDILISKISKVIETEPYVQEELSIYTSNLLNKLSTLQNIQTKCNNFSKQSSTEKYNFIVTSDVFQKPNVIQNILQSLIKDGFLMTIEELNNVPNDEKLNNLNCKLITKYVTEKGICLLIRKTPVWKTPMVVIVKTDSFNWIDGIKMALRKHKIDKRNTMIIFHGNEPAGVIGLMKSIRREPYGTGLRCLFTDDSIVPYKIVDLVYINYFRKGLVFNVYKNGEWGSYRHFPVTEKSYIECEHAHIAPNQFGNLASLSYFESRIPLIDLKLYPMYDLCYVYYCAIYALDIRSALGHTPYHDHSFTKQGAILGHEFSGRNSKGQKVFGMISGGALATTVLADRTTLWEIPDKWTMAQAATIPRLYLVAYYALIIKGNLQKDETVYINAGVSGLCIACINVILSFGGIPFLGFNNSAEKKYLLEIFPELPEKTFINLEESSFEYQLLETTNGEGVNIIFDTTNSQKRNLFIDALAYNGRFLEFEKNVALTEALGYTATEKNITIYKISHNTLWVNDSGIEYRQKIHELIQKGIENGTVKPVDMNIFSDDQITEAFRAAQSGKFFGKIVIKIRDEEPQKSVIPKTKIVKAYPNTFLNSNLSYIVTTGLSECGIQIVEWLISRGANKIYLLSPYKPVTGLQSLFMRRWQENNINVVLDTTDASLYSGAENVIQAANALAPVGGIFLLGYVSCEAPLDKCTQSHYQLLWKTKVEVTKNLDVVSRKMCPTLKYFVGFSDIASIFGKYGKSMLGYSCSAMEMIYENRRTENYPATIIQNGLLHQFGVDITKDEGFTPVLFSTILKMLPQLLNQPYTIFSVYIKNKSGERTILATTAEKFELVNAVADVLGIRFPQNAYTLTFEDIGIEPCALAKIKILLETYGIVSTNEEIKNLSFAKIESLITK